MCFGLGPNLGSRINSEQLSSFQQLQGSSRLSTDIGLSLATGVLPRRPGLFYRRVSLASARTRKLPIPPHPDQLRSPSRESSSGPPLRAPGLRSQFARRWFVLKVHSARRRCRSPVKAWSPRACGFVSLRARGVLLVVESCAARRLASRPGSQPCGADRLAHRAANRFMAMAKDDAIVLAATGGACMPLHSIHALSLVKEPETEMFGSTRSGASPFCRQARTVPTFRNMGRNSTLNPDTDAKRGFRSHL